MSRHKHPADRRFLGARALLNLPGHHSTGAIVAEVEDSSRWRGRAYGGAKLKPGCDHEPKVIFQIANCDRSIQFGSDMETRDEQTNEIYKLDVLIESLEAFRDALKTEHARYNKRATKLAAKSKKK